MYQPFSADAQGSVDYAVDVIPIQFTPLNTPVMCICSIDAAIYITKDQAMLFFGLTDQPLEI